jgi:endonuclease/exonuclease/phosphatase (EEP) superfamily protein YafD
MKYKDLAIRYATALTWVYFTFLFGWLTLYLVLGDQFGLLGIINSLLLYMFVPLPLAAIFTALNRRWSLVAGTLLGVVIFLWLWGPLFMLPLDRDTPGDNPNSKFTVMTYNVLGLQANPIPAIEAIHGSGADLVLIQELNPAMAESMKTALNERYPYQILDPQEGVSGMGTISQYPLESTGDQLPLKWIGIPQVITIDFEGTSITVVNFHTFPVSLRHPERIDDNFRYREAQAKALAEFASLTLGPLIVAGDANATHLNDMYKIILDAPLQDAWWEGGFGFGHTYPGSALPGSSRPRIGSWSIPKWMVRIDYVFVSSHWQVEHAFLAPFDGISDHRGVIAELILPSNLRPPK